MTVGALNQKTLLGGDDVPIKHIPIILPDNELSGYVPTDLVEVPVQVQTLSDWMKTAHEEQMYLLDGLLPTAGISIISGRPKLARKSQLMYEAMLALASGKTVGPFVPLNKEGEHVIIFQQENTKAGNFKQWDWIARGAGLDLNSEPLRSKLHFYYKYPKLVLENDACVRDILKLVKACGAKQLVFDSLRRCSRGNENDSEASNKVGNNMSEFQRVGCGIMLLHHIVKTSRDKNGAVIQKDIDEALRGSGDWAGMYDAHWGIYETDDAEKLGVTTRDKNNGDSLFDLEWFFDRKQCITSFTMKPRSDADNMARLESDLLSTLSLVDDGVPFKRVVELLAVDKFTAETLLAQMIASGKLAKVGINYRLKVGGTDDDDVDQED